MIGKNRRVIDRKYLPVPTIGVFQWLVVIVALDYFGAAGLAWGLICGVLGLLTIALWWARWDEEDVKPSELEPEPKPQTARVFSHN